MRAKKLISNQFSKGMSNQGIRITEDKALCPLEDKLVCPLTGKKVRKASKNKAFWFRKVSFDNNFVILFPITKVVLRKSLEGWAGVRNRERN